MAAPTIEYLRRFYVYTLSDPRDGAVFYVGKGCGTRMYAHQKEAKAGRIQNGRKHAKIISILNAGLDVRAEKVVVDLTECEALDEELRLIREIGIRQLTNVFCPEQSIQEKMIEVTKVRYMQCTRTIALAEMGYVFQPGWVEAEKGWKESCERILMTRGVKPTPWSPLSHAA